MLKSKRKTILILALTLILALATALCVGCAENEVEKELKLDKYSVVLQTEIFTEAEILAESDYDVEWSSSDESVVKVIGGRLKMQGLGKATITAKSNGQTKTCSVEVKEFLPKIELSEEEVSVKQTKTEKVSAIVKSHGEIVPGVICLLEHFFVLCCELVQIIFLHLFKFYHFRCVCSCLIYV